MMHGHARAAGAVRRHRPHRRRLCCTGASDGRLQPEAEHAGVIDLLLTDVVMPGLGGPALTQRLLARRPAMKVLYTTGYIDDDVAHHGVLQPDVAVLEQPFALETTNHQLKNAPWGL